MGNEGGRPMVLQGSGFAAAFQMEYYSFTVAPSGTEWSDAEMPHSQFTSKSGAAAKLAGRETRIP